MKNWQKVDLRFGTSEHCDLHVGLARILVQRMAEDENGEADLAAAVAGHYLAAGHQPEAMRASVPCAVMDNSLGRSPSINR